MKIAGVEFPDPLITALRDGQLVIFAGAGVSMGEPAGLPDFVGLAHRIAKENGRSKKGSKNTDKFLGRLQNDGVDVHSWAAKLLQQNDPKPTELHQNLLQVYSKQEDIRIVTTNFDLLFEQAFDDLFTTPPKVSAGPDLPPGKRCKGIVHIHGSINEPKEMVLTKQDFGRAYLTEFDGWARRFLVDLFKNFIVLFVGYSHRDTIMMYLTLSLSEDANKKRYALTGANDAKRWRALGITPIPFMQSHKKNYDKLYKAVETLAGHIQRDMSDWRREITRIAQKPPPIDEESSGLIEYALSEPETARLFTATAKPSDWIAWVRERKDIDELNTGENPMKIVNQLDPWLAQHPPHLAESLTEFLTRRRERNEILAEWTTKVDHESGSRKLAGEQADELRGGSGWLDRFWQNLRCKIAALFRSRQPGGSPCQDEHSEPTVLRSRRR